MVMNLYGIVISAVEEWKLLGSGSGRFDGKTVIITNSAGSIGLATARLLHEENANIVMNDERIDVVRSLEGKLGSRALATDFDLSKAEAATLLAQKTLDRFKSIDILVCNEGRSDGKAIADITADDWDRVMEKNLTEILHALQGVYRSFRSKQHGTVVLVSSVAARSGCGNMVGYSSSMGGVLGIMKTVSKEWSRWGVTCSAVCPGPIAEGDQGLSHSQRGQFAQTQVELANRNVTAEQVAKVILFLASEEGRPINGQAINLDYGLYLYSF